MRDVFGSVQESGQCSGVVVSVVDIVLILSDQPDRSFGVMNEGRGPRQQTPDTTWAKTLYANHRHIVFKLRSAILSTCTL